MPETIKRRPEGTSDDTRTNVRWSEHEYAAVKAAAELAGDTNTTRFVRTKLLEAIGYMAPEQAAPEVPWEVSEGEGGCSSRDPNDPVGRQDGDGPPEQRESRSSMRDTAPPPASAPRRGRKSPKRKAARSKPKTRSPAPSSAVVSGAEAAPSDPLEGVKRELGAAAARGFAALRRFLR